MTIADLKQTVGRATRTCGQKGLEFQPGIGWPLFVYNYYFMLFLKERCEMPTKKGTMNLVMRLN